MDLIEKLTFLGLSNRQAKVYIALLKLGTASAIEIAKYTNLTHPTTYDILSALKTKGLVTESYEGKFKRFSAEDPTILQQQERQRRMMLDDIMPNLQSLYTGGDRRTTVRFYDGYNGNVKLHEDLLNVIEKEYFYFGSVREMFDVIPEIEMRQFYKTRIERGIWSNAIRNQVSETEKDYMQSGDEHLRRVRYLPVPMNEDIAGLYLYDNKIAISSGLKENYVIIIESHELSRLLKNIWKCLWEVSK